MTLMEWCATVLGIACVVLAARRSMWTFPAAIGSVTLVGVVVFRARLYSDAVLQLFFVAANVYGWVNWRRARDRSGAVTIRTLGHAQRIRWVAGIAAACVLWGGAMDWLTDAALPWWDAAIAAASIAAQWLMGQRRLENWWLWIAVDCASVPLYLTKGLNLFAGLYLVYLALAIWGWISWWRVMRMNAVMVAV